MNQDILLVNKPKHWSSNDVVRKVKKILQVKKVGHAGTLDPLASGLLILGINKGTKRLNELLLDNKTYRAIIHFNYFTDTYDAEGMVQTYEFKPISLSEIKVALDAWVNQDYWQLPPRYSAIKIDGQRAYELARKQVDFTIQPKLVKLLNYQIVSFDHNELVVDLMVTKGFYIRSFAYDLGRKLNNYANLAGLTRTKIGEYSLENAYEIEQLYDLKFNEVG